MRTLRLLHDGLDPADGTPQPPRTAVAFAPTYVLPGPDVVQDIVTCDGPRNGNRCGQRPIPGEHHGAPAPPDHCIFSDLGVALAFLAVWGGDPA
jgi:hypothetical protein